MFNWLYKILFILIGVSFFISATEINLGEAHNTFFDEYDTYVKTEQVTVDHASIQEHQSTGYVLLYHLLWHYRSFAVASKPIESTCFTSDNLYPPRIFLRNSVWRI